MLLILSCIIVTAVVAVIAVAALLLVKLKGRNQSSIIHQIKAPISTDGPLPPKPYDKSWIRTGPIYQIYPRSFQDSDGDGTGDLRGIISRLDYLQQLGIRNIWISPIYKSPMKDFGYDISNYTMIDPLFGTMQDFDNLISAMHKRGMKCIMDFVPNHSSDQHPWFQQSLRGDAAYKDYYVWKNPVNPGNHTPNNWLSAFGNTSWQWSPRRNQYYLHQYLIQQPDLNYRNPNVNQDMLNVLRFWINHNVDGFRMDAIVKLVEDAQFRNNPWNPNWHGAHNDYNAQIHEYNTNQNLTYKIVANWVNLFRQMGSLKGKYIASVVEATSQLKFTMKYYSSGVDFPFNFNLAHMDNTKNATFLKKEVDYWIQSTPSQGWPNWVLGSHDIHRVSTRMGGTQYTDAMNMLLLLLPGTPVCYYGDEIANQRYLVGEQLTEADWRPCWRLFTTLIRFDAVYLGLFKCNKKKIGDYKNISCYLKELYNYPGIKDTANMDHIKRHYFMTMKNLNPSGIVPKGPEFDL